MQAICHLTLTLAVSPFKAWVSVDKVYKTGGMKGDLESHSYCFCSWRNHSGECVSGNRIRGADKSKEDRKEQNECFL